MKKNGIMTMHRVVNYGSFLQAYSLKKITEKIVDNVEFVDYKFEKELNNAKEKKSIITKIIEHYDVLYYIKYKKHTKRFSNEYKKYLEKYLNVSDYNYEKNLDNLIIGSDEVFNCIQPYPVGYSRNLFGYGYDKSNVISYAASFGYTTLKKLEEYKIENEIAGMLNKFTKISVRDNNSYEIVKELIGKEPMYHFDPVIVGDFADEVYNSENVTLKDYIVVYAYPNRLSKTEKKYIKKFAKKYNKKIVSLGFYQSVADYNLIVDPFMALNYIKNADFVITDTFHGTVFSIKMNTKFCTIIRKSNSNKLTSLLKSLFHSAQMVNDLNDIDKIYNNPIDFSNSNEIIEVEKNKTINYLKENLK